MFPLPHGKVWQTFLLICGLLLIEEIKSEIRIVCYYTNWSIYRPGTAKFSPQNINPYLCTHLIYAFGGFTKDNALKPFDKYQDIEQGGYAKFTGLKSYNKNLKTLLAIGGWNEGSSRFSPLVANPERRHQFIKNILKFLRQNHFDGLDLDWEYPAFRDGGKPRDKENYAQFVEELRLEFDKESAKTGRPRLLLTMAVPAGIDYVEKGYDIPKLNKYLDWFNLLTYDYHSAYEPSVNHHSPLKSLEEDNEYNYDSELNIDYTIKYYLKAGADRDKLVLGIPTYGRSYTLVNEEDTSIGAPADGPGEQGDATREKGYLAYYEICQALRDDPEWKVIQPNPEAMGPYAYMNNQWVGYDDEEIVRRKAEYVVENRLGGIMFWSIDNDDFRGACSGKPYPLIEIGKSVLLDRLGDEDNEVARPNKPRKTTQRSRARQGSTNRNKISENTFSEKTTAEPKKRVINQRRSTTRATTVSTTSISSLSVKGRTTTPEPPTTPDPGTDFKCEEEGFFSHPRDCKKYFWCLDSGPSNLGIVAHQFTCPSGLYFNTIADSCDFSRNVLCKKSQTTTKASNQIEKTSTTTTTTTSSPKITAATSRSTFLRHTTTTTTPEPEISDEEYEDEYEEEHSPISKDSEEDPKVIKELIELIKKVGGLEELEKQLHLQEDGSMILKSNAKQEISTTPSSISKSLYHKVLSRPNSLNSLRNRFGTSRTSVDSTKVIEDAKSDENDEKIENKYSSVIRNSRPSPQNAGIDKLPEFEGFLKERPKYVTINRTRTTQTVLTENDKYNNSPIDDYSDSDKDTTRRLNNDFEKSTFLTQTPSYVNIRRSRPTKPNNADGYANDATEGEPIISTSKFSYQSINRRRGTTESSDIDDEQTTKPTNIYRYKSIERPKLLPQFNSDNSDGSPLSYQVEDSVTPSTTVQYLDLTQQNTKSHSIQKSDTTTRTYANIERRTTTTTVPDITTSSTMLEAAITLTPELTTSTKQSIITTTVIPPLLSSTSNTLQSSSIPYEDIVLSSTENIPNNNENSLKFSTFHDLITTGLDTEGYETTAMTHKNTDTTSHKMTYNNKDEVTLINKKKLETIELKFPGTTALYTNTKLNSSPKNTEKTDYSLSKTNVDIRNNQSYQDTIKNLDIELDLVPTTPTVFDTSISTTAKKNDYKPVSTVFTATNQPTKSNIDKDIQVTVSSPRPFGFPRKRTRPTFSNKILTTTSQTYVDTISDTTLSNLITKKVSFVMNRENNNFTNNLNDINNKNINSTHIYSLQGVGDLHANNYKHNNFKRNFIQTTTTNPILISSTTTNFPDISNSPNYKKFYSWKDKRIGNYRPWHLTNSSLIEIDNSTNIKQRNSSRKSLIKINTENNILFNKQDDSENTNNGNKSTLSIEKQNKRTLGLENQKRRQLNLVNSKTETRINSELGKINKENTNSVHDSDEFTDATLNSRNVFWNNLNKLGYPVRNNIPIIYYRQRVSPKHTRYGTEFNISDNKDNNQNENDHQINNSVDHILNNRTKILPNNFETPTNILEETKLYNYSQIFKDQNFSVSETTQQYSETTEYIITLEDRNFMSENSTVYKTENYNNYSNMSYSEIHFGNDKSSANQTEFQNPGDYAESKREEINFKTTFMPILTSENTNNEKISQFENLRLSEKSNRTFQFPKQKILLSPKIQQEPILPATTKIFKSHLNQSAGVVDDMLDVINSNLLNAFTNISKKSPTLFNVNRRFQNIRNNLNRSVENEKDENLKVKQINNGNNVTLEVINGRRVKIVKKRRPTLKFSNSDAIGQNNYTLQNETEKQILSRPFRKVLKRKRPLTITSTTTATTLLSQHQQKLSTTNEISRKRFRKVLRKKTPLSKNEDLENNDNADVERQNSNNENEKDDVATDKTNSRSDLLLIKSKFNSSRKPYRPTKPSLDAISSSSEATITTSRSYIRKYSNNFTSPKPPSDFSSQLIDRGQSIFLSRPLIPNRQPSRTRKPNFRTNKISNNENQEFNFGKSIQLERPPFIPLNRNYGHVENKDENDYDDDEKQNNYDLNNPQTNIRNTNSKIQTPNLTVHLNNGFVGYIKKTLPAEYDDELDEEDRNENEYEDEDEYENKNDNDELNENEEDNEYKYENENEKENEDVNDEYYEDSEPFLPTTSTNNNNNNNSLPVSKLTTNKQIITSTRPTRPTNRPRVINRPTFTTIHPASLKTTQYVTTTKTKPTITKQYARTFSATTTTSTENTLVNKSFLDEAHFDAINARNKKIFDNTNKKHTLFKTKQIQNEISSNLNTTQQKQKNLDNKSDLNPDENLNNFDTLQENVLENSVSSPTTTTTTTTTRRPPSTSTSTTTTKITTLHHIFAIDDNEDFTTLTSVPTTSPSSHKSLHEENQIFNRGTEKLVEINRVVEVYSKENKLKLKANTNDSEKVESTNLKIEKLPTIDKLGEISRVKHVQLVESGENRNFVKGNRELVIESRSTVADYTPTESSSLQLSTPVRNVIPIVDGLDNEVSASLNDKKSRELNVPEALFGIETSTISLEGLFETARKAKDIELQNQPVYAISLGEVQTIHPSTENSLQTTTDSIIPENSTIVTNLSSQMSTTITTVKSKANKSTNYIRPLVPFLRPESNESSPLVISIANFDNVILSKIPKESDSSAAFSGQIKSFIESPKILTNYSSQNVTLDMPVTHFNNNSNITTNSNSQSQNVSQALNKTVVETKTSYSIETKVVRGKRPRKSKNHKNLESHNN